MKPTYIIAELSANHGQFLERAKEQIIAAKQAGADAVKVQTYTADTMTIDCDKKYFKIGRGSPWAGCTMYTLYKAAAIPWEWHQILQEYANDAELDFFSTPFDITAVNFLENLQVPYYKIASFEITDLKLIQKVAETGKPIFLSTGMATIEEIMDAVLTIQDVGKNKITLLKCTSAYPAPYDEMNLNTIPHMMNRFNLPVGLSDHSLSTTIPSAAVALGATVIEKHLTISRFDRSPDSTFSLEPDEFKRMVTGIRETEAALGKVLYSPTKHEQPSMKFRRSLFVVKDIKKGELLTEENIRCIRPGYGIAPRYLPIVYGKTAKNDIKRGTPLEFDLFI